MTMTIYESRCRCAQASRWSIWCRSGCRTFCRRSRRHRSTVSSRGVGEPGHRYNNLPRGGALSVNQLAFTIHASDSSWHPGLPERPLFPGWMSSRGPREGGRLCAQSWPQRNFRGPPGGQGKQTLRSGRALVSVQGYLTHKKRAPLGPYRRPVPRVLEGSERGGRFLMSEVPPYRGLSPSGLPHPAFSHSESLASLLSRL